MTQPKDNAAYLRQWATDIRENGGKSVDADRLDDIAAELDRLRAEVARQWQPIETAPLDVKWLLTWDGSHYHIATRLGWTGMKPTHWMPLPAPPGKEER